MIFDALQVSDNRANKTFHGNSYLIRLKFPGSCDKTLDDYDEDPKISPVQWQNWTLFSEHTQTRITHVENANRSHRRRNVAWERQNSASKTLWGSCLCDRALERRRGKSAATALIAIWFRCLSRRSLPKQWNITTTMEPSWRTNTKYSSCVVFVFNYHSAWMISAFFSLSAISY